MRLRQRTKVDLPQPEGPIRAVAWFAGIFRLMLCKVWLVPYQAFRSDTSMATPLTSPFQNSTARYVPDQCDGNDDKHDQHQGAGPGETMPVVVRGKRIHENLQRKGGNRLIHVGAPELVPESR